MSPQGWLPALDEHTLALVPPDMIHKILAAPLGAVLLTLHDDELIYVPDPAAALAEIDRRVIADYNAAVR